MKKIITASALALTMILSPLAGMALPAYAAGGSQTQETEAETPAAITGTWECIGADFFGSGEYMDAKEFEEMMEMPLANYMSLQFWDNSQGLIVMGSEFEDEEDSYMPVTWTESKGTYTLDPGEWSDDKYSAAIDDDGQLTLKITESGDTMAMLFKRTGDPDETSIFSLNFNDQEATQRMSAFMQFGRYVIKDGIVYGCYYGDRLAQVEIKKSGKTLTKGEESILAEDENALYLSLQGDLLYYISRTDGQATGIHCLDTATGKDQELIAGQVDYLAVTDNYLYYTDENYQIFRAGLDGKKAEQICEDEAYYVYPLSDNFIVYQDDAQNETLVLYNIATQEKSAISPEHSHHPVIADGFLYYITKIDGEYYLSRTDMMTGDMETGDYVLSYASFFIYDGEIYLDDGFHVSLDKWDKISDNLPAAWLSTSYCWVDDDCYIEEGISAYNLYNREDADNYIAMMTNEDWEEFSDD